MIFMGIDIGNTGIKIGLFDEKGSNLFHCEKEHGLIIHSDGYQEIDAATVLTHFYWLVDQCVSEYPEIEAIAVSCMAEAFTPIDNNGKPLRNTLLTQDMRAQHQATGIEKKLGREYIKKTTGVSVNAKYTAPKIMWLRENEAEIFRDAAKFTSWIGMLCTAFGFKPYCDFSYAGKTMMLDIQKKQWDKDILRCIGVSESKLDVPVQAGTCLGIIKDEISRKFGFNNNPKLVVGSFDQACVSIGCGVKHSEEVVLGMGTVFCLINSVERSACDILPEEFPIIPDIFRERYITTATVLTAGQLVAWSKDTFYKKESVDQNRIYEFIMEEVGDEPGKLLMFPYFAGSGTLTSNPNAKGAIIGLTIKHTRGDLVKAAMEGVAYELKLSMETLEKAGIKKKRIIVTGGGSKSKKWLQIISNVMNMPVDVPNEKEAGTLGAAMLAAYGAGHYSSLEETIKIMVSDMDLTLEPDTEYMKDYRIRYGLYKKVYTGILDYGSQLSLL